MNNHQSANHSGFCTIYITKNVGAEQAILDIKQVKIGFGKATDIDHRRSTFTQITVMPVISSTILNFEGIVDTLNISPSDDFLLSGNYFVFIPD